MLLTATKEVFAEKFPDLHSVLRTATQSVAPWASVELLTPLACVASSAGLTDELDLSLVAFLAQLGLSQEELQAMQLFPAAAAALFVSDQWGRSQYLLGVEAFHDNEHAVQYAVGKLLSCFYTMMTAAGVPAVPVDLEDGGRDDRYHLPKTSKQAEERGRFKEYATKYVQMAAQTLLTLRASEQERSQHYPYRAMSQMLDFFVRRCCPALELGALEQVFPNALTHASLLDMALGKQLFTDTAAQFSHTVVRAVE